jgi:uncharacterized membrane protein YjgN (DUF898 family)
MKLAGVVLLILVALLTSVRGSPLATDNPIVNLALTLVLLWLIVRWVSRRGARPRLSTPTQYRGVAFRSRTEAAWAELFDRDGLEWHYEAKWFKLRRHGRRIGYLPDFEMADGSYVEIKGASPTEEEQWKCQQVANITGHEVKLLAGWPSKHSVYRFEPQTAWQMIW